MNAAPVRTGIDLPSVRGAYVLLIETVATVSLVVRGTMARLAPGTYLYCGSARGPGGIRARVGRHLKAGKTLRWHVDRLTEAGRITGVIVAPDGDECDLFDGLRSRLRGAVPVAGFGSSDCRRCPAHLLSIPDQKDVMQSIRLIVREDSTMPESAFFELGPNTLLNRTAPVRA